MNKDTIQTLVRYALKAISGALILHGYQHASVLTSPDVQAFAEEGSAAVLGALSLWWSKSHQQAIASTGNTQTFTKPSTPESK